MLIIMQTWSCASLYNALTSYSRLQINIYINHWGKFQLRLCPLSDPSTAMELAELSDTCLDQVRAQPLRRSPSLP